MVQIVCKYRVIVIDELSKMGIDYECDIVMTEVFFPSDFKLDHSELVSRGCFGCCDIEVDVIDVNNDELF